jgi:hypothetical protein
MDYDLYLVNKKYFGVTEIVSSAPVIVQLMESNIMLTDRLARPHCVHFLTFIDTSVCFNALLTSFLTFVGLVYRNMIFFFFGIGQHWFI